MLIIRELNIGTFLLIILLQFYTYCYLALSFYLCTYWVPIISVLNLVIFPCYSNLLLRRRRLTGILRWEVLGYVLPWLPFLWSYEVFHCSVSLRVIIVFRDITHVIIILYSWHLIIYEHFGCMCGTINLGSCIRWVLGFGIKTGYDRCFSKVLNIWVIMYKVFHIPQVSHTFSMFYSQVGHGKATSSPFPAKTYDR
jgi:hypothetical protein